jgi:hypothetical protein
MPSLSRDIRRLLEKTIAGENGARRIAEAGAEESLHRLAVDHHEPHTSLTPEERTLRNRLRAHGRQLGDKRDSQRGRQTLTHLKQAVAYEHWHRMLFARFLAENDLLLHPEHGVAISLDEVKELALSEHRDWIEVAAAYAQRMLLREVFRPDDPVLSVPLSPEKRLELESRLNSLPREVFLADDSLGWVYQFWQEDVKDEVNRSEIKIGADELPSVTQLFTEDYMVLFLLENTLGAWWTGNKGIPDLPGYKWSYLRLDKEGIPAAGPFGTWPRSAKELRVLDPCMGSGHFLTFALPILVRMRMAEEGSTLIEAISAVLRENLFGLELDARCSQIAAFNLALTAWKLAGRHFQLPRLNLACSGFGINAGEEDWVKLAGGDEGAQETMRKLYNLFSDAPILGSLIDPTRLGANLFLAEFNRVRPLLEEALSKSRSDDDATELAVTAQGSVTAARILSEKFTLVITNVPYRVSDDLVPPLRMHLESMHKDASADLATSLFDRLLRFCSGGASAAVVIKHEFFFAASFDKLRKRLLGSLEWNFVVRLGPRAFETISGEVVNVGLMVVTRSTPSVGHLVLGMDASAKKTPMEKATYIQAEPFSSESQGVLLKSPKCRISFGVNHESVLLSKVASTNLGICSGDYPRFGRLFWEVPELGDAWATQQSSVENTEPYGGRSYVFLWEDGQGQFLQYLQDRLGEDRIFTWLRGKDAWGKRGVLITTTGDLPSTLYSGGLFDNNVSVLIPTNEEHLPALWAFCSSPEYCKEVRKINQSLKITDTSLVEIPFDLAKWEREATIQFPSGLPQAESADPTQWIFTGHPKDSSSILQVAVARLLGYRWPRQTGSAFSECAELSSDSLEHHVVPDGIACLSAIAGQESAADRLRALLQSALGADYRISDLITGRQAKSLENWLTDKFFTEHCRLFEDRPFIWHIWDGLADGFHSLVNYHKLDARNLEKLIYSYLGDWLTRQKQDLANGVEGADTRVAAAEHLQNELKNILVGHPPFDIFVRWKSLKEQPVGWVPDVNDGVRVNIRPWITAARLYRAAKPGVLRVTPNIKYTKDRGKDPTRDTNEFPWFKKSSDRVNDHHLTREEKNSLQEGQ